MSLSANIQSEKPDFNEIQEYIEIVRIGNGSELEELAGDIPQDKIPLLIRYYYHTQDWDEKCALVELLRFDEHEKLPDMMLDFLRAPKEFDVDDSKEYMLMAKANALRFMGTEYDIIEEYYDNLNLIVRDTSQILAQKGLDYYPLDKAGRDEIAHNAYQDKEENRYIYKKTPQEQLIYGIEEDLLDRVKIALKNLADVNFLITEGDHKGMSMLMLAIFKATFHHNLDIVHLLLDEGADIHVIRQIRPEDDPNKGQTALWWAADLGDETLVRRLLDAGAVPNIPDQHDYTPRLAALYVKHQHVADILQHAESKIAIKAKPSETVEPHTPSNKKKVDKNKVDKVVKPSYDSLVMGILVSCLLFSLGVGSYILSEHLILKKNHHQLDKLGLITEAVIINKKYSHRVSESPNNKTKSTTNNYSVYLRFDANSEKGKNHQGVPPNYKEIIHSVGESTYMKSHRGDTMDVKYLPDNPEIYEVINEEGEYPTNFSLYFAIASLLGALFFAIQIPVYYKTGKTW